MMSTSSISIQWYEESALVAINTVCKLLRGIRIGYIPGQRDIRPIISHGRGQWLSEAEEVPRRNESTGLSQGM